MDQAQQAFAAALRILSRRDHSEAELRRKLGDRGYLDSVQDRVVARLKALGYLDDRRSARQWAESAVRSGRGFGPKLRMELTRRGFPSEIVEETLAGIAAHNDERDLVREILSRKFPAFDPLTASDRDRRRVMGYLQRRGFAAGVLFRMLRDDE
ncbi:MAG TPA: regulatory protein RecX [Geomobilimonas sp.]|nr:regulatory protein RecX [Geomobilimonas sp.]